MAGNQGEDAWREKRRWARASSWREERGTWDRRREKASGVTR